MTNLNVMFHVVVSVYRLVNIWNLPQFPAQFQNGPPSVGEFTGTYILSAELNKICIFILFNLEFGVAKDKLVSSSYKYNP